VVDSQAYNTGSHGKAKKFLVEGSLTLRPTQTLSSLSLTPALTSTLIQGVGKDTVPGVLDFQVVDEMFVVTDTEAFNMCHKLARTQGIFAGGSSGLNVHGAVELGNRLESAATIVTIMCDTGIKYLSKASFMNQHYTRKIVNPNPNTNQHCTRKKVNPNPNPNQHCTQNT